MMINHSTDILSLLALPFAVYAITYLIRYVDGPFNWISIFRTRIGIYDEPMYEGEVYIGVVEIIEDKFLAKLFSCFWCLSAWITVICILILEVFPIVIVIFAVIGASNILNGMIENGKTD